MINFGGVIWFETQRVYFWNIQVKNMVQFKATHSTHINFFHTILLIPSSWDEKFYLRNIAIRLRSIWFALSPSDFKRYFEIHSRFLESMLNIVR